MSFNKTVNQILEDFNIYPASQNAVSAGPDQGTTTGDINNTFPSRVGTMLIKKISRKNKKRKPILKSDSQ